MDKIRSKWEFLIQSRPNVRAMIGNTKLIGGHFSDNGAHNSKAITVLDRICHMVSHIFIEDRKELTVNIIVAHTLGETDDNKNP